MKKFIFVLAISGLFIANPIASLAVCNNCDCQEKGYVNISATADKEVAPDTVEVSLSVTTYDSKSMQKATVQNKEISDKVYSALKGMINTSNGDFVRTTNYNATALYNYNNNKRVFDKYQVSNDIVLRTKSLDQVGKMIDTATSLGATSVKNLNFVLSSMDSQCDDLLAEATKKTYARAGIIAKASGSAIAGVKNLSVNYNNTTSPRVVYSNFMMKSAAISADGAVQETSSPIEAGTIKLKVTVNATYLLK